MPLEKWQRGPDADKQTRPTELMIAPANFLFGSGPFGEQRVNILPATPGITYRLFNFTIAISFSLGATATPQAFVVCMLQTTGKQVLARLQNGAWDDVPGPLRSLDQDFKGYTVPAAQGVDLVLDAVSGVNADASLYGTLDFLVYTTL